MQINTSYAAAECNRSEGGEMERKGLKLKEVHATEHRAGDLHCAWLSMETASLTAAALARGQLPADERRVNSGRSIWYFHLLMSLPT